VRKLTAILIFTLLLGATGFCPAAELEIRTLKLLAVIYRGAPESPERLNDAALKGTINGIELGRLFYFRNTRCKLNLEITYLIVDAPAPNNAGPTYDYIVEDLRARGIKDGQYDGIFCTGVGFLGNFGGFRIMGKTGASFGGTDRRGNFSWCPEDKPDVWYGTAWTFVHEFQHALDSPICTDSGHPEMLHGHPYADSVEPYFTWGHRGAMHWDWIAHTLSSFQDYLDVRGVTDTILKTADADDDGMPDEDARLPMDEKRFGSNPTKRDTDGDGLDDLAEFCADIYRGSDPQKQDTDEDGIPDGKDRNPTVAIAEGVAYANEDPKIDGRMDSCYKVLLSRPYAGNSAELEQSRIYACWNEDALYLFVKGTRKCTLDMLIDTSAENGFWEGGDTYPIRASADGKVTFFELGLSGNVPGAKAIWGTDGLEIVIPALIGQGVSNEINWGGKRRPEDVTDGLVLTAGRRIGFNLILSADGEKALFTPNWSMFDTTLAKSPTDRPRPSLRFSKKFTKDTQPTVVVTGVSIQDKVKVVNERGSSVGERLGSGTVVLTGKLRVGSDPTTGSNMLKAVCRGVESKPINLVIDDVAMPPVLKRMKNGSITISGEPKAKVDIYAGTDVSPVWPVLTVDLDEEGRGSVALPKDLKGFVGAYGLGTAFDKPLFVRLDEQIKFDYQGDACDPRLPAEGFCIRWTGYLQIDREGEYTFYLSTDDGSRLWIDDQLIVDNWGHHAIEEKSNTVYLARGEHEIRVDYYEEYGWAAAHLEWSGPGISRSYALPVRPWPRAIQQPLFYARQTDNLGNKSIFRKF